MMDIKPHWSADADYSTCPFFIRRMDTVGYFKPAEGYGQEHHPYINHGTGDYIDHSKEVVDVMVKAWSTNSDSYTLQSVYDSAPGF